MVRRGRLELVVGRGRRRRILILQAERQSDHVDEVHHRALDPAGSVMWMKGFRECRCHVLYCTRKGGGAQLKMRT